MVQRDDTVMWAEERRVRMAAARAKLRQSLGLPEWDTEENDDLPWHWKD